MAFDKGAFSAPELDPNHSGLFSIIKPETYSATANDERWVRGYAQEYIAEPTAIVNYDDTDTYSDSVYTASGKSLKYIDVKPFFVEVEDTDSTFGLVYEDRFKTVTDQLEAATQKAVEKELHDGRISLSGSLGNPVLASGATVVNGGTALSAARALAALEHEARQASPTGEQPIIHMSADVASVLGTKLQFDKDNDVIVTRLGSKVVIGAGYSGNGVAAASATASVATNVVTINTGSAHYLTNGQSVYVNISGANITVSGTYTATVTDADTFTIPVTTTDASQENVTGFVQGVSTLDSKWIYATGDLDVHLGAIDVVNDTLAQGYDVSGNQNDMKIKAFRTASVHFDTSIHLAVKVDLTA